MWRTMYHRNTKPNRRTAVSWSAGRTAHHSWLPRSFLPPGRCTGKTARFGSTTMSSPLRRRSSSPGRWPTRWRGSLRSRRGRTARCSSPPTRMLSMSTRISLSMRFALGRERCSARGRTRCISCAPSLTGSAWSTAFLFCPGSGRNGPGD